ncbi:hypothetical protein GLYMA_12G177650v4 [Glycine max]|nr:hypothetical protein GLYMA_12G177650v4 [Glycine max]
MYCNMCYLIFLLYIHTHTDTVPIYADLDPRTEVEAIESITFKFLQRVCRHFPFTYIESAHL